MFLSTIRGDETKRDREGSGKTEKNVYYIKYYRNYIILHKNSWCNSFIEENRDTRDGERGGLVGFVCVTFTSFNSFPQGPLSSPHICLIKGNEETLFTGNGGRNLFLFFKNVYILLCCLKECKEQ